MSVRAQDTLHELSVFNANSIISDNSLGRLIVDLSSLPHGEWQRRKERLKEAGSKKAEIEFEIRLDRADNGVGATTSNDRASEQELERLYAELHRRMAGHVDVPTAASTRGFEPMSLLPMDDKRLAPPPS